MCGGGGGGLFWREVASSVLKMCKEVSLNSGSFVKCAFNNGKRIKLQLG